MEMTAMIEAIPIITPRRVRKVRSLLARSEETAIFSPSTRAIPVCSSADSFVFEVKTNDWDFASEFIQKSFRSRVPRLESRFLALGPRDSAYHPFELGTRDLRPETRNW